MFTEFLLSARTLITEPGQRPTAEGDQKMTAKTRKAPAKVSKTSAAAFKAWATRNKNARAAKRSGKKA